MAQSDDLLDPDLDAQLRGLFQQAEQAIEGKADPGVPQKRETSEASSAPGVSSSPTPSPTPSASAPTSEPMRPAMDASLMQLLMPLVHGLEAITKATGENTAALKKLETTYVTDRQAPTEAPRILADLKTLLDTKNTVSQG